MKKSVLFALLLFITLSPPAAGAVETELWRAGISLIPYPQMVKLGGADFVLGREIQVVLGKNASPEDRFTARELARGLKEEWGLECRLGETPAGKHILLTRDATLSEKLGDQGYRLEVYPDRVAIKAAGADGLFYGVQTLLQLIQEDRRGPYVKGMEITDWPDIPERAVHYDTKHFQEKFDYVKGFIRTLARYKVNMLIWEWEDKFAYRSHPEIGAPGAFTMQEMQELTRYARKYHIQLVPLIQGLGHASYILKWPKYAHLRESPASNWEFCPLKDGTYKLLFDLYDEAIEATPGSKYIHIGSDETYELGKGTGCGCREKMAEVGRYGLYQEFIGRCARYLTAKGRRVMAWDWPERFQPGDKIKPPRGLVLFTTSHDFDMIRRTRDAGYPVWFYDPNPGIEHLFLPYFYRETIYNQYGSCLERSYRALSPAAIAGVFDGMVATSWNCSGVHNQVWMLRYITAAEYTWSGKNPPLAEFQEKYFKNYYGPDCRDLPELFLLLNKGSYYYMDTFERKVWHWGEIGKTHLPDLPRDDLEYDPYWNTRYGEMVKRSRKMLPMIERALDICRVNRELGVKNAYDLELFAGIARLFQHTCNTYIALSNLEKAIGEAHRQHFVDRQAAYRALERAEKIIVDNLAERERVFNAIKATWEKTQLPRGMSTPDKTYFHARDRGRNFANRRPDLSFMIYDEQLLGLENYLERLRNYMEWYKKNRLGPETYRNTRKISGYRSIEFFGFLDLVSSIPIFHDRCPVVRRTRHGNRGPIHPCTHGKK